jgi:hypothetical protein
MTTSQKAIILVFQTACILWHGDSLAWSHGGGLDSNGGHRGPTGYHQHGSSDNYSAPSKPSSWSSSSDYGKQGQDSKDNRGLPQSSGNGNQTGRQPSESDGYLQADLERFRREVRDYELKQRTKDLERARTEARTQPRTDAKVTPRTSARNPKYQYKRVGKSLEIEVVRGTVVDSVYYGTVRLLIPKRLIAKADLLQLPRSISPQTHYIIVVLLETQDVSELPWAKITSEYSGYSTLTLVSGLPLEEDINSGSSGNSSPQTISDYRLWTDISGNFKKYGILSAYGPDNVDLILQDRTWITVALNKLCNADNQFLESLRPDHGDPSMLVRYGTAKAINADTIDFTDMKGSSSTIHLHGLDASKSDQVRATKYLERQLDHYPTVRVESQKSSPQEGDVFVGNFWLNYNSIANGYTMVDQTTLVKPILLEAQRDARQYKIGVHASQ